MKSFLILLPLATSLVCSTIMEPPLKNTIVKLVRPTPIISSPTQPVPTNRQEGHNAAGVSPTTLIEPFAEGAHSKRQETIPGPVLPQTLSGLPVLPLPSGAILSTISVLPLPSLSPSLSSSAILISPQLSEVLPPVDATPLFNIAATSPTSSPASNPTIAYAIPPRTEPAHPANQQTFCEANCDSTYIKCMDRCVGTGQDVEDCKKDCVHDTCLGPFTGCWACGYFDEGCASWKISTTSSVA